MKSSLMFFIVLCHSRSFSIISLFPSIEHHFRTPTILVLKIDLQVWRHRGGENWSQELRWNDLILYSLVPNRDNTRRILIPNKIILAQFDPSAPTLSSKKAHNRHCFYDHQQFEKHNNQQIILPWNKNSQKKCLLWFLYVFTT